MRKMVAVLFSLACMAYITGCGGSSSSTASVTVYDTLTTPYYKTYSSVVGGRIPKGPLTFTNYSVSTFSGSSAGFSNHTSAANSSALFDRPIAITADKANLYVADYVNHAIRKINIATQNVTTLAGITGLAGSIDTAAGTPSFNLPRGITTDGTNLYVADSGNYTIRKIVISSGVVTTLAGAVGVAGSVDATVGTNARFNGLIGITTDGTSLYVTDSNNTIRRIVIDSGIPGAVYSGPVTTLAGSPGATGSADGIQAAARFNQLASITTDGPNLYVTDFGNNTIRKIALATAAVTTIAGIVGPGGTFPNSTVDWHTDASSGQNARFNHPNGITTDGANLYVTDSYDNMVRKIVLTPLTPGSTYSGPVTTIAGAASGLAGGSVDGPGTVAKFNTPIGIATDGTSLFITDNNNHTIRKIQ